MIENSAKIIEKCRQNFIDYKTISVCFIQRKYKVSFNEASRIKNIILNEKGNSYEF